MTPGSVAFATVFYALAALSVVPAIAIFFAKDVVRQAFWLLGTLTGFAGLYLLLGADFLGFTQVLVYIGGIMVLLLFGVMLTHRGATFGGRQAPSRAVGVGLIAVLLAVVGSVVAIGATTPHVKSALETPAPTTQDIGVQLLTTYVLPFELVSLVLLAALVGAAYVARRGTGENV